MKYVELIDQKPLMCVPTCLLMILKRRNLDNGYSQIGIAKYLDFRVSEELAYKYPLFPIAETNNVVGANVRNLNSQFFQPSGLPLEEDYRSIKSFLDIWDINAVKKFIISILAVEELDLMASIDHAVIQHKDNIVYSHVVLVESIEDDMVTIITPIEKLPTYRETVSLELFISAMAKLPKGNGGLWIIK